MSCLPSNFSRSFADDSSKRNPDDEKLSILESLRVFTKDLEPEESPQNVEENVSEVSLAPENQGQFDHLLENQQPDDEVEMKDTGDVDLGSSADEALDGEYGTISIDDSYKQDPVLAGHEYKWTFKPLGDTPYDYDEGDNGEDQFHDVETPNTDKPVEHNVRKPRPQMIDEFGRAYATGRRKTSVARVWIRAGPGNMFINKIPHTEYLKRYALRSEMIKPFMVTDTIGQFDVWCTTKGGGLSGQAEAIRLGVAKALQLYNPEWRPVLKRTLLLRRDMRKVERKKVGRRKARKRPQWVRR